MRLFPLRSTLDMYLLPKLHPYVRDNLIHYPYYAISSLKCRHIIGLSDPPFSRYFHLVKSALDGRKCTKFHGDSIVFWALPSICHQKDDELYKSAIHWNLIHSIWIVPFKFCIIHWIKCTKFEKLSAASIATRKGLSRILSYVDQIWCEIEPQIHKYNPSTRYQMEFPFWRRTNTMRECCKLNQYLSLCDTQSVWRSTTTHISTTHPKNKYNPFETPFD